MIGRPTGFDVVILGGGLAGLTAAVQLKQLRPKTTIAVVDKRLRPAPLAAYKVGESVAEIGAHYLRDMVGLEEHLDEHHLRKFALRIFSSAGGNEDIARRPEVGLGRVSPLRTYQLDRGSLENALADQAADLGVELLDGTTVTDVTLGPSLHTLEMRQGTRTRTLDAKWVMDASGRAGLLRRKLDLTVDIPHDVNAAWFRLPDRLAVDDWSEDELWQARVPGRERWRSTCHLVGRGYWIWLIALPGGQHSVGVVADPAHVPFERIRRYDVLREWAEENEPQLASKLPSSADDLMDFGKVKDYAFGVRRGISPQRWCLTGEAALFLDPLYATGTDFIAIANTLGTRMIVAALDDEPEQRRRLKAYNAYLLGQFLSWGPAFMGQYEIFGSAQATAAKVLWDNLSYFTYPVLMFNQHCILDYDFVAEARSIFQPHFSMNVEMQRFFREWSCLDDEHAPESLQAAGFATGTDELMGSLFATAASDLSQAEVREALHTSLGWLRSMAAELTERMADATKGRITRPRQHWGQSSHADPVVNWVPYEARTGAPVPQPAGAWMLR